MDKNECKSQKAENGVTYGILLDVKMQWSENLTVLDLSERKIVKLDDNVVFPPNLVELDLSNNNLSSIPAAVLNLEKIQLLNLSHNSVQYFDDFPNFIHNIVELNLSNNQLAGPPYWIWTGTPSKLVKINLSCNTNLSSSLDDDYLEELLQYTALVTEVIIFKCRLGYKQHLQLLGTMTKVKILEMGTLDHTILHSNQLGRIPCLGLDQCLELERLNLSNTGIYSIESNIDIYKNLIEINLSDNKLHGLPQKFCDLENLEVCILSYNSIIYLPDDMVKLKKLVCLHIDFNELCTLPDGLCRLPNLKILDLYYNNLCEVSNEMTSIEELDLAQNYIEEPDNKEYLEKRDRLRLNYTDRHDGRRVEKTPVESEHSPHTSDDEELLDYLSNRQDIEPQMPAKERTSSPEDWDSEEYWVPGYYRGSRQVNSPWQYFVKKKMEEGNFCPVDLHTVPVAEKVRYERLCNPRKWTIVEGQFDDCSEDDS